MTARRLWAGLLGSWCLAGGLLLLVRPPASDAAWPEPDAAVVGLAVGVGLAWLLVGRRPVLSPAVAVTLALTAGAEEIVWRWFAFGTTAGVLGPGLALVLTSAGFGAVHPGARLLHVGTGATFGTVYLVGGGLLGAWCAHCAYNLIVAAAARRAPPEHG